MCYSKLLRQRQIHGAVILTGIRRWHPFDAHLLPSPFASLCFLLYATRSLSVNPSCAVMKLMLCCGPRPPRHFLPPLLAHQSPAFLPMKLAMGDCNTAITLTGCWREGSTPSNIQTALGSCAQRAVRSACADRDPTQAGGKPFES